MLHAWTRAGPRGFPGDPSYAFALLQDPVRGGKISPWRSCRCCPRATQAEGLSFGTYIEANTGLQHPLATLHERRRGPCKTRFLLAGCASTGRGSNLLDRFERFQVTFRSPFQDFSCRREGQTQTQAGHARTRRSQTANRAGRDRRCLSRRPTQRRHAQTWGAWQDTVRRCRRNHARGKAGSPKLRRVGSFCGDSIAGFANTSLQPNCVVVSEDCGASAVSPMPFVRIRS
jgi:hypothetical protein